MKHFICILKDYIILENCLTFIWCVCVGRKNSFKYAWLNLTDKVWLFNFWLYFSNKMSLKKKYSNQNCLKFMFSVFVKYFQLSQSLSRIRCCQFDKQDCLSYILAFLLLGTLESKLIQIYVYPISNVICRKVCFYIYIHI